MVIVSDPSDMLVLNRHWTFDMLVKWPLDF